jgi:putative chitinase
MSDFGTALRKLWPNGDEKIPGLRAGMIASAPAVFARYGITTPLLVAHVMAQGSHECGAGHEVVENIHYTAERAVQVWPSRFSSAADCYRKVGSYAGDPGFPVKLIDCVYGSRMGNRPGTHDGSTFIGRGFSQTTGRDEYVRLGKLTGLDLVDHPELLLDPAHFLECGVADFVLCGCLPFARDDDVVNVTKRLNGGTVGLAEREQWLAKWRAELGTTPIILGAASGAIPTPGSSPGQAPGSSPGQAPSPHGGGEKKPRPQAAIVPKPPATSPSITNPSKGSVGAFIASILIAIFKRKG